MNPYGSGSCIDLDLVHRRIGSGDSQGTGQQQGKPVTVQETGPLTTESGALVADNQNSEQGGRGGPVPVQYQGQDQGLLEELARFHRGRIVHARGVGAWAVITSTSRGRLRGARSCMPYLPSRHICRA
jgi:hypothetical protein